MLSATLTGRRRVASWALPNPKEVFSRASLRPLLALGVTALLASAPADATAATLRATSAPLAAMVFFAGLLLVREWPGVLLDPVWASGTLFAVCVWLVGTRYRPAWLWLARKSLVRRTAFARFNPATPSVTQEDRCSQTSKEHEVLLSAARQCFLELQAAWDRGDVEGLRRRTTAHMLDDLLQELTMRGDGLNRTDVVTLDASLLTLEKWDGRYVANVQFSGMIRESADLGAAPFREVWMLTSAEGETADWRLARQQALL
ncbi:MAG: Tim44-like domain-containing protein [Caldimonas sp.]